MTLDFLERRKNALRAWHHCLYAYSNPTLRVGNAAIYTTWDAGHFFISVAGTNDIRDVKNDLRIKNVPNLYGVGRVGAGFISHHQLALQKLVHMARDADKISVSGHSLGGAAGELIAEGLTASQFVYAPVISLITFGQPPAGDKGFAQRIRRYVYRRYTKKGDPVPAMGSNPITNRVHSGLLMGTGRQKPGQIRLDYIRAWPGCWRSGKLAVQECHSLQGYRELVLNCT